MEGLRNVRKLKKKPLNWKDIHQELSNFSNLRTRGATVHDLCKGSDFSYPLKQLKA